MVLFLGVSFPVPTRDVLSRSSMVLVGPEDENNAGLEHEVEEDARKREVRLRSILTMFLNMCCRLCVSLVQLN